MPPSIVALLIALLSLSPTDDITPREPQRSAVSDSVLFGALADGAGYRRIRMPGGAIVHVIDVDTRRGLVVEAIKAGDSYDGRESLDALYQRAVREARANGDTILAALNAGSWFAERHAPVGPLVVNGEVVEMKSDDAWSSLVLFGAGGGAITRDRILGQIFWRHRRFEIRSVNRRPPNDQSVVLYNRFYGEMVPSPAEKSDAEIVRSRLAELDGDDTGIDFGEEEIDTAEMVRSYRSMRARELAERKARKVAVRRLPLSRPNWYGEARLNDTMWTVITMVDTGTVPVPRDGYVLSLGSSEDLFGSARPGDTVRLHFQIADNAGHAVHDILPGYPQLLVAGRPAAEPDFVQGPAAEVHPDEPGARSAIGISPDGATIYLIAVEAPSAGHGGMTIDDLAATMRTLGAHNALALEGRGATTMIVNYEAVTHGRDAPPQRPVSSGLIVRKKRNW